MLRALIAGMLLMSATAYAQDVRTVARALGDASLARTFYQQLLQSSDGGTRQPAIREAQKLPEAAAVKRSFHMLRRGNGDERDDESERFHDVCSIVTRRR